MVVITASGITLDGTPTTTRELADRMADALAVRDERTCLVKASGVSYGTVVDVLDIVSGAGAERLGIVR